MYYLYVHETSSVSLTTCFKIRLRSLTKSNISSFSPCEQQNLCNVCNKTCRKIMSKITLSCKWAVSFHVSEVRCQINGTCWVCSCEGKAREIYFKDGFIYWTAKTLISKTNFNKIILRWEHLDNLFKGYSTHSENPLFISLHENNCFGDPLCLLCISILSFL